VNKHEWRERTEGGELRKVRALHHGGNWRFMVRLASDDGWNALDPVPSADLETLRDVLLGKYKRNRVPHHQIQQIDDLLAAAIKAENKPHTPSGYDNMGKRGRRRGNG